MNYLQEHYSELSELGKGVLICYHDKMVEMAELENLSSKTYKDIVSIEKDFIKKIKEEYTQTWNNNTYTYTREKYSNRFFKDTLVIKGVEDFKKDFPYFPLENIITDIQNGYYYYRYTCDNSTDYLTAQIMILALKFPQLELMYKTKFKNLAIAWVKEPENVMFSRCFKNGKNLEEITKLPKYAWNLLVENTRDIGSYNEMRIWVQKENLSKETLEEIFSQNLYKPQLEKVRKLCTKTFNGKSLYTIETLLNYLHRCDVYQAIYTDEAIDLLNDYIKMSIDMGVEPLTNSNSLKREHDVMARNYYKWYRANRNAMIEEKFKARSEKLQKYEYENDKYIIITPHSVNELLEEANQQRNCLACYSDSYADGRAQIFFMRKKSNPNKSYISIEMNSDMTEFRQKYYACNQRVDKEEDLEFLNEWKEHIANL